MKDYSLYDVLVPNSIKLIKKHAFHMCYNLKRIDLNNVISIGDFAFNRCYDLEQVINSEKIINLGIGAFRKCQSLKKIKIPHKISTIKSEVFAFSGLTTVDIPENIA